MADDIGRGDVDFGHPLDRVFRPRSVVFVGASADPHKLSGHPPLLATRHRFAGAAWCVNPRHAMIAGLPCVPTLDDVPGTPDIAFVSLPAAQVPASIEALGARGVPAAIILSSGFDEVAGGGSLAGELARAAGRHGMRIVGPNSEGIWSVAASTVLTFGSAARRDHLVHGPIAVVSQSGAIGGGLVRQLQDSGFGLSYFVSTGNEVNLSVVDYLEWLVEQPDVRVILVFLEGLRDGARLGAIAARARARGVRIVTLKGGNSAVGREATASHTGKISTRFSIYRDVFAQHGILAVDSLTALLETGMALATQPAPRAGEGGLAVVSVPGGTRSLIADQCETLGLPLARFSAATEATLRAELPHFAVPRNPIDLTGEVLRRPETLASALGHVAGDPSTRAVLLQLGNGALRDIVEKRALFRDFAARWRLPFAISFLGDALDPVVRTELARDGIWCARDCHEAVAVLARLFAASAAPPAGPASARARETVEPGSQIAEWRVLEAAGVRLAAHRVLTGDAPPDLAGPLAIKAMPADADHKTEHGLLHLGVTPDGVAAAVADIRAKLGRPEAPVLAQAMARGGIEMVLALRIDADFGPVLTIGAGGADVELHEDVAHVGLPASRAEIAAAVGRLRIARKFAGWRGAAALDVEALLDQAEALASLGLPPSWTGVELNPVIVGSEGAVSVDVLIEFALK